MKCIAFYSADRLTILALVRQESDVHGVHRPHRALAQRPPTNALRLSAQQQVSDVISLDRVHRRDLLGGLIHEYQLAA